MTYFLPRSFNPSRAVTSNCSDQSKLSTNTACRFPKNLALGFAEKSFTTRKKSRLFKLPSARLFSLSFSVWLARDRHLRFLSYGCIIAEISGEEILGSMLIWLLPTTTALTSDAAVGPDFWTGSCLVTWGVTYFENVTFFVTLSEDGSCLKIPNLSLIREEAQRAHPGERLLTSDVISPFAVMKRL